MTEVNGSEKWSSENWSSSEERREITFSPYSDDCCPCSEDEDHGLDEREFPKRLTIETSDGDLHVTIDYGQNGWETEVSLPVDLSDKYTLEAVDGC